MLPDYMADGGAGLVPVLPELEGPSFDTFFVYPDAMKNQAKLKVFRDFMFALARDWKF
jgi:DNA-binding transcriptional LysR family regulator